MRELAYNSTITLKQIRTSDIQHLDSFVHDIVDRLGDVILDKCYITVQVHIDKPNKPLGRPINTDLDINKAITLRTRDELSYREIAKKLNCSAFLIYSRLPKEVKEATKHLETVRRERRRERKEREMLGGTTI